MFRAYPATSQTEGETHEPKAVAARLVGQADIISGWIVKVVSNGDVHQSRDVRFVNSATRPTVQEIPTKTPERDVTRPGSLIPPIVVENAQAVPDSEREDDRERAVTLPGLRDDMTSPQDTYTDADGAVVINRTNPSNLDDSVPPGP